MSLSLPLCLCSSCLSVPLVSLSLAPSLCLSLFLSLVSLSLPFCLFLSLSLPLSVSVCAGFARSFGMRLASGERREWIKPIMFSGGLGAMEDTHIKKEAAETGACRLLKQSISMEMNWYEIGV